MSARRQRFPNNCSLFSPLSCIVSSRHRRSTDRKIHIFHRHTPLDDEARVALHGGLLFSIRLSAFNFLWLFPYMTSVVDCATTFLFCNICSYGSYSPTHSNSLVHSSPSTETVCSNGGNGVFHDFGFLVDGCSLMECSQQKLLVRQCC